MRKQIVLIAAVAVAVAACEQATERLASPADAVFTKGISGPTWVYGTFLISGGGGSGFEPGENAHPQGLGSCRLDDGTVSENEADNTTWFNSAGQWTNSKFCQGSESTADRVCNIGQLSATYALGSDNENLNFDVGQSAEYDAVNNPNPDLFVHWRQVQNDTRGKGILNVGYDCDDESEGVGTIDLSEFDADHNRFETTPAYDRGLDATGVSVQSEHGVGAMTEFAWHYRCQAGAQKSEGCE
jgi:hypothetical protein